MRASHNGRLKGPLTAAGPIRCTLAPSTIVQGLKENDQTSGDRSRARTCTPLLRRLLLDPGEPRSPCLVSPISERLISDQSERDRSMDLGNYPTEGWRFWVLLAGIVMAGLLGLVMV